MTIQLYNSVVNTVIPNPTFFDVQELNQKVTVLKALDGTPYAYPMTVKNEVEGSYRIDHKIEYDFQEIQRDKIIEVLLFVMAYHGQWITLSDYNDVLWKVRIVNSSFSATTDKRHKSICTLPDAGSFRLEFNGVKL